MALIWSYKIFRRPQRATGFGWGMLAVNPLISSCFPFSVNIILRREKVNNLTGDLGALYNYNLSLLWVTTQWAREALDEKKNSRNIFRQRRRKLSLTIIKCASQSPITSFNPRARQRKSYFFTHNFLPCSVLLRRRVEERVRGRPSLPFYFSPTPLLTKQNHLRLYAFLLFFMLFFHYTHIFPWNLIVGTWIY